MTVPVAIRDAGAGDAAAIAALHAASWRSAYRGILPDAYLDGDCPAERLVYWRAALADPAPGSVVLIAERGAEPIGFAAARLESAGDFAACLDNLHMAPAARGLGVGRHLLGAMARRLADAGHRSLCLWVFDANRDAFSFYERLGAVAVETGMDSFAGAEIPHTRLGWQDSARLAEACGH